MMAHKILIATIIFILFSGGKVDLSNSKTINKSTNKINVLMISSITTNATINSTNGVKIAISSTDTFQTTAVTNTATLTSNILANVSPTIYHTNSTSVKQVSSFSRGPTLSRDIKLASINKSTSSVDIESSVGKISTIIVKVSEIKPSSNVVKLPTTVSRSYVLTTLDVKGISTSKVTSSSIRLTSAKSDISESAETKTPITGDAKTSQIIDLATTTNVKLLITDIVRPSKTYVIRSSTVEKSKIPDTQSSYVKLSNATVNSYSSIGMRPTKVLHPSSSILNSLALSEIGQSRYKTSRLLERSTESPSFSSSVKYENTFQYFFNVTFRGTYCEDIGREAFKMEFERKTLLLVEDMDCAMFLVVFYYTSLYKPQTDIEKSVREKIENYTTINKNITSYSLTFVEAIKVKVDSTTVALNTLIKSTSVDRTSVAIPSSQSVHGSSALPPTKPLPTRAPSRKKVVTYTVVFGVVGLLILIFLGSLVLIFRKKDSGSFNVGVNNIVEFELTTTLKPETTTPRVANMYGETDDTDYQIGNNLPTWNLPSIEPSPPDHNHSFDNLALDSKE